jgi:Uncharacterised nucleotidyltransferase
MSGRRPPRNGREQQLILLSAGTAARRQSTRGQAEELGALVDWPLVAELLRRRRLLALLGPRLVELAPEHAGERFATAVTQALDAGRRQSTFLQLIGERVIAMLAGAGIRCTALKGPTLSQTLYGDPGRRPSSDIDLLVAQEQLYDAVEVVRELGYGAPGDHVDKRGLPRLHFALVHEQGQLPPVELHWRIHWYERSFAPERLLAPPGELGGAWRPAPIDELTGLLLFYARDGFLNLRHATDLGACWDAFGPASQPGALDRTIRAYPALEHVLLAAALVAERTVGLPLDRLTAQRASLGRRGRIAVRLANSDPRSSEPQLYADMGLIDGLLAPPGDFRGFIERQVIPPRAVLEERAHKAQQPRPSSTLGHSVRTLGRYGLAMTGLLFSPRVGGSGSEVGDG